MNGNVLMSEIFSGFYLCRLRPPLRSKELITSRSRVPPVSLRLGHAAGLTVPRTVIQYRAAASLPKIREKAKGLIALILKFSEHRSSH